jgi:hypothetical protein
MAQPIDITRPAVHGSVAALVTHPGYYYLYALYADYPINNAWFRNEETAALLAERLRVIQPLLGAVQPYRKSAALRLFTERAALERFPPERVAEAWRQLRALLERLGPPPGWPEAAPPSPRYEHAPPPSLRRRRSAAGLAAGAARSARPVPAAPAAPAPPRPPRRRARRRKSPVDYTQDV